MAVTGGVDIHLHCCEPGRTDWEGFATASAALAMGGFTSFADMPLNAMPATVDAAAFALKRRSAERASLLDFGLWGGLVPGDISQLAGLRACPVAGFKAFMCQTGSEDFRPTGISTHRSSGGCCPARSTTSLREASG